MTNSTSFLDHVYVGCTQRECKPNEAVVEQYTKNVRITHFQLEQQKISGVEKSLRRKMQRGPTAWRDMLENVSSGTVNWQIREFGNYIKFQIFAWMIISSSRKNSKQMENVRS